MHMKSVRIKKKNDFINYEVSPRPRRSQARVARNTYRQTAVRTASAIVFVFSTIYKQTNRETFDAKPKLSTHTVSRPMYFLSELC